MVANSKDKPDPRDHSHPHEVRDAGPDSMRDKPVRKWKKEDQESDQSFPASDPPGNY